MGENHSVEVSRTATSQKKQESAPGGKNQLFQKLAFVLVSALALRGAAKIAENPVQAASRGVTGGTHRFLGHGDQDKRTLIIEMLPRETSFNLLYGNLSNRQKMDARMEIAREKQIIESNLSFGQLADIESYESLIKSSAEKYDVPADLLLGLVIVESRGDPFAISDAGAKGLTQMMDEMAQNHNLKISDDLGDQRFNPELILPAAAREISEAHSRYGDWSLALWEWHAGAPQVYEAIKIYLSNRNLDLPDINVESEEEAMARMGEYKKAIAARKINVYKLFKDQAVSEMFRGREWDQTEKYVPRIAAAAEIFRRRQ